MNRRHWLGFDVGGANIKLANTAGYAASESFPLWKNPLGLADKLREMILAAPTSDSIVATMTGTMQPKCGSTAVHGKSGRFIKSKWRSR